MARAGLSGIRHGLIRDEGSQFMVDSLNIMDGEADHLKGLLLVALGFMGVPHRQALPDAAYNFFKTSHRETFESTNAMVREMHRNVKRILLDRAAPEEERLITVATLCEFLFMEEPELRLPARPTIAQTLSNSRYQSVWLAACYARLREYLEIADEFDIVQFAEQA